MDPQRVRRTVQNAAGGMKERNSAECSSYFVPIRVSIGAGVISHLDFGRTREVTGRFFFFTRF